MTVLEKILLSVGGAGALYGLYNNWRGIPPMASGARGLFNIEEPESWERLVDETTNEDGEAIRRRITEVSPSGGERFISDTPPNPFGRALNFPNPYMRYEGLL